MANLTQILEKNKKNDIISLVPDSHYWIIDGEIEHYEESGGEEITVEDENDGNFYEYRIEFDVKKSSSWNSYNGNSMAGGYYDYDKEVEITYVHLIAIYDNEGTQIV